MNDSTPIEEIREVFHTVMRTDLEPDVRSDAAMEIVAWLDNTRHAAHVLTYPDGGRTIRTNAEILAICERVIREELSDS